MKYVCTWILIVIGMVWFIPQGETHTLTLKNGQSIEADEVILRDGKVVARTTVAGGSAEIPYPLELVEQIEWKLTEAESALLDSGDAARLGEMKAFWLRRQPFLEMKGSDAGRVGVHYVRMLLANGDKKLAHEALEWIEVLRRGDWNATRKSEAARLRVSALAVAGRLEEAMKEADAMQDLGAEDDAGLAEARTRAKFVQAEVAWRTVRQLEEDWPKWHLMPEKRATREIELNRALDHYLFPVVAHPELRALCAEGLFQAAQILRHIGQEEDARLRATELIEFYPEPTYVGRARELLQQLKPKETSGKTS
ncbi:MAG: tol-pal system YbgF family protein [Candidatus Methylacidiphilales bacterium]